MPGLWRDVKNVVIILNCPPEIPCSARFSESDVQLPMENKRSLVYGPKWKQQE